MMVRISLPNSTSYDHTLAGILGGLSRYRIHQTVGGRIDLFLDGATLLFAVRDCNVDQAGVGGFVRCSKQQRRIRCRILVNV